VVIEPGQVGVQHAFGKVSQSPLLPGVRFVPPWSEVERYSTREEQFPQAKENAETMAALSSEQMGMQVDVAVRWKIEPSQAPRLYMELGDQPQIEAVVLNAIRNGVRDGMVQFSINDISQRNEIANVMKAEVDSALITQPRAAGRRSRSPRSRPSSSGTWSRPHRWFRRSTTRSPRNSRSRPSATWSRDCAPAVGAAEAAQRDTDPEALMKQYLEVLHDMKQSNNLVVLVPTEGESAARHREVAGNLKQP
jgi:hypothetical protein